SRSGLAPRPTQQPCSDSVTITPASTASNARPPFLRISQAPLFAFRPESQVDITIGLPLTVSYPSSAHKFFPKNPVIEVNAEVVMNFLLLTIVLCLSSEIKAFDKIKLTVD